MTHGQRVGMGILAIAIVILCGPNHPAAIAAALTYAAGVLIGVICEAINGK